MSEAERERELRRRFKLDPPTDVERAATEDPRIAAVVNRLTELSRRFSLGWGQDVILAKAREVMNEPE